MWFPNNSERGSKTSKSTNWEFGRSRNTVYQPSSCILVGPLVFDEMEWVDVQLKESPTFFNGVRRHDIKQILDSPTIEVVPVIRLYD